jgi:uncharacterized protein YneF (UPF0154 family)
LRCATKEKLIRIDPHVTEKAVIKSLYDKLGMKYEEKRNNDFMAYLNDAIKMINE